ncbi:Uncharacterised protein [BD1-7 clade bacterium]|uniref:Mor transcription activator domain-containing protein n=1 Tax=BD1-7 clade bacterium TaxID=2029982 RepID=A0A5S9P372_9GAMM|nr:Uncharacterised protein [BD1-7 clade bacterium]CAA0122897.1 Uncharacterised protein [BD1-7 clade bacterium]
MNNDNHDMFTDINSDDIYQHLDDIDLEQRKGWPQALSELIDVLAASRLKHGEEEKAAKRQGLQLALAVAEHFGGMQFYLPKAKHLEQIVRDIQIWQDFDGSNTKELARKYDLTEVRVYGIIREQRRANKNRLQNDLFI